MISDLVHAECFAVYKAGQQKLYISFFIPAQVLKIYDPFLPTLQAPKHIISSPMGSKQIVS